MANTTDPKTGSEPRHAGSTLVVVSSAVDDRLIAVVYLAKNHTTKGPAHVPARVGVPLRLRACPDRWLALAPVAAALAATAVMPREAVDWLVLLGELGSRGRCAESVACSLPYWLRRAPVIPR